MAYVRPFRRTNRSLARTVPRPRASSKVNSQSAASAPWYLSPWIDSMAYPGKSGLLGASPSAF
jgi:hypothetical protein